MIRRIGALVTGLFLGVQSCIAGMVPAMQFTRLPQNQLYGWGTIIPDDWENIDYLSTHIRIADDHLYHALGLTRPAWLDDSEIRVRQVNNGFILDLLTARLPEHGVWDILIQFDNKVLLFPVPVNSQPSSGRVESSIIRVLDDSELVDMDTRYRAIRNVRQNHSDSQADLSPTKESVNANINTAPQYWTFVFHSLRTFSVDKAASGDKGISYATVLSTCAPAPLTAPLSSGFSTRNDVSAHAIPDTAIKLASLSHTDADLNRMIRDYERKRAREDHRFHAVKNGESLLAIAAAMRLSFSSTVDQRMYALYKLNRHAFPTGNMNHLLKGALLDLRIGREDMLSPYQSSQIVDQHYAAWKAMQLRGT